MKNTGFAAHTGPIVQVGPSEFELTIGPKHLNDVGQFHSGMVITLVTTACHTVATREAVRDGLQQAANLLSLECHFLDTVQAEASIRVEVNVTSVMQSAAFLSANVRSGDETLATASAVYRIAPAEADDRLPMCNEPLKFEHWAPLAPSEPFGQHVGTVYEQAIDDLTHRALFHVDSSRLDPEGRDQLHDGMALYIANLYMGRAATAASGARCETLAIHASGFQEVPRGAWPEFEARVRRVTPEMVFVDGTLSLGGSPSMEVSSVWKILSAHE